MTERQGRGGGLARRFSWSVAGRAAAAGLSWGILVLLAKFGPAEAAAERVGTYVFALAVTGPLVPVLRMELRSLVAADADHRTPWPVYARVRRRSSLALLALSGLLAAGLAHGREVGLTIAALALVRAAEGELDLAHGAYQRDDRHDLVGRSELLRAALSLLAAAALMWQTGSVPAAVLAVAVVTVASWWLHDRGRVRIMGAAGEGPVDPALLTPGHLLRFAWRALPLGVGTFLLTINTTLPRYFIDAVAGKAALGIFGAAAYLMAALTLINGAMIALLLPRFGRQLAQGDPRGALRDMLATTLLSFAPGVALAVAAAIWGDQILALLYLESFAGQRELLVWLALAHTLGAAAGVPRAVLTAAGELRIQPMILGIGVLVCAAMSIALIPDAPLLGAAWALLASRGVILALNLGLALRALARRRDEAEAPK